MEGSLQTPAGALCSECGNISLGYWILPQILRTHYFDLHSSIILCVALTCGESNKDVQASVGLVWNLNFCSF